MVYLEIGSLSSVWFLHLVQAVGDDIVAEILSPGLHLLIVITPVYRE